EPPAAADRDCLSGGTCSGEWMAASEMQRWQARLNRQLAQGSGLVCRDASPNDGDFTQPSCDGTGPAVVKVFWQEPPNGDDDGRRRQVSRLPW
ncbi:MAG: hypothetical protein RQ826_12590, partial [Xanthomonadales bacterium]|nr:hypothetical protein [Xanthomonadales bacterium]